MERLQCDILISGGGVAGLIAACSFGSAGFSVICVDPLPPVTTPNDVQTDRRSTAFLQPARTTLEQAGIWQYLAPFAAPLQVMRLADANNGVLNKVADFDAAEISDLPFGWNLPNWLLRREILRRIDSLPNVRFESGVSVGRMVPRSKVTLVNLSDGRHVETRLVVGADGRHSSVREMLGIPIKTWRYGQKALVFTVSHPAPHDNVSTEIHQTGGPFTLVPLQDADGAHHSAVVWMDLGRNITDLAALNDIDFAQAATERCCGILGPLTLTTSRKSWPIIAQKADQLIGPRTALIAEAAHVVPPIGAQGLNMSLADIQTLLDLAIGAPETLGDQSMLDSYAQARMPDITKRIQGVNFLNKAAIASSPTLRALRLQGLKLLHGTTGLRRSAMHAGMGRL